MAEHYQRPDWFTQHVFNPMVQGLTRLGVSIMGSRILEVRGRRSGEWRRTPVNLRRVDGVDYLVAPRGHTQWVRNLRAAGGGRLILGRQLSEFSATEVPEAERPRILRSYLKRWSWEVGQFFEGVSAKSTDVQLLRVAGDHPVFRLEIH
jgi:deazaflavin-dependent oxidoreductase (nitroreductase family)